MGPPPEGSVAMSGLNTSVVDLCDSDEEVVALNAGFTSPPPSDSEDEVEALVVSHVVAAERHDQPSEKRPAEPVLAHQVTGVDAEAAAVRGWFMKKALPISAVSALPGGKADSSVAKAPSEAKQRREESQAVEREAKRAKKEQEKEERERAKEAVKAGKASAKEAHQLVGGKKALDHVSVLVDEMLGSGDDSRACPALLESLTEAYGDRVLLLPQQLPGTITWKRTVHSDDGKGGFSSTSETAPQVVVVFTPDQLEALVESDALDVELASARALFPEPRPLCLLVPGLRAHIQRKPKAARVFVQAEVDAALQRALVFSRVAARCPASVPEACLVLSRITRAVAEEPYRVDASVSDLHRDAGAAAGARNELSAMEALLGAIPGVGEAPARAIAKVYPSLRALADVYRDPGLAAKDKELLLQDVWVDGGATSSRKGQNLGPKRSARIHRLFVSRDPKEIMSTLNST